MENVSLGPGVRSFRDLKVWQKAIQLTVAIYRMTRDFPREELYGLTSQIRRSDRLEITRALGFSNPEQIECADNLSHEVGKMLFAMIGSLPDSRN